jgi:hypothetical protein
MAAIALAAARTVRALIQNRLITSVLLLENGAERLALVCAKTENSGDRWTGVQPKLSQHIGA